MTAYATSADFIAAFSQNEFDQLTDKDNTGTPELSGFNKSIALASEIIDSAIGGRYVVPLTLPVLGIITQACLDIARWYLYDDCLEKDSIIQRRYDQALKTLEKIAVGDFILGGAALVDSITVGKAPVISTGDTVVFTEDYLGKLL